MASRARKISCIAVSGSACSGKTTLATQLAIDLGWRHTNVGQIFRDLARDSGLPVERFGSLDDASLRRVDAEVQSRMKTSSHCVWEGRLTAWLAGALPQVMSVYCFADDSTRAYRCARRERIPVEDARRQISKRDEEEQLVFKRLYNISDIRKEAHFDLVIDTSTSEPRELLKQIEGHLKKYFEVV